MFSADLAVWYRISFDRLRFESIVSNLATNPRIVHYCAERVYPEKKSHMGLFFERNLII